jgi:hypothetical protein
MTSIFTERAHRYAAETLKKSAHAIDGVHPLVFQMTSGLALQRYLTEIGHDLIGSARNKRRGLRAAPDPNTKSEPASASRTDARGRILEHDGAQRGNAETSGGFAEHVRSWLAAQTELVKIDPVDTNIESAVKSAARRISSQW